MRSPGGKLSRSTTSNSFTESGRNVSGAIASRETRGALAEGGSASSPDSRVGRSNSAISPPPHAERTMASAASRIFQAVMDSSSGTFSVTRQYSPARPAAHALDSRSRRYELAAADAEALHRRDPSPSRAGVHPLTERVGGRGRAAR